VQSNEFFVLKCLNFARLNISTSTFLKMSLDIFRQRHVATTNVVNNPNNNKIWELLCISDLEDALGGLGAGDGEAQLLLVGAHATQAGHGRVPRNRHRRAGPGAQLRRHWRLLACCAELREANRVLLFRDVQWLLSKWKTSEIDYITNCNKD